MTSTTRYLKLAEDALMDCDKARLAFQRYRAKLQEALPDTVDLLGIVLGTGLALDQAMTRVILPVLFVITLVPGLISVLHDMELLGIGRK